MPSSFAVQNRAKTAGTFAKVTFFCVSKSLESGFLNYN